MRRVTAAIAIFLAGTTSAYAAGPSVAEVEQCLRDGFNNTDPALFHQPGNPLCPAWMDMFQVSITDTMVSGSYAAVKVFIRYRLKQAVYGSSFVAESCARGHYGDANQLFPAGSLWHTTDTIRMQQWSSGWKC